MLSTEINIVGLILSTMGALILIWTPANIYLRSLFNEEYKKQIEQDALNKTVGVWGGKYIKKSIFYKRNINYYRDNFFGFLFLIIGFILQLWSLVV